MLATMRWNRDNPEKYLVAKAKRRAKRKGIEFDLTESDIIIPDICPIMQEPFNMNPIEFREYYKGPSIHRLDNSKGYVPDNITIISYQANVMIWESSTVELERFAKGVLREAHKDRPWNRDEE